MMESKLSEEQHALLRKVLLAQTESHGSLEMPVVEAILSRHQPDTVLDIGCGEGSFLLDLAGRMPASQFVGIDHSPLAIDDALEGLRRLGLANVTFRTGFFDGSFDETAYGAVITRYTLQHSSQPQSFVNAAFQRLKPWGVFVALESLDAYTDCHQPDPVWERFRDAVAAVHARVGSNANIGKSLGVLMRRAGFRDIRVRILLCSPSTVGWEAFRAVVLSSARLANLFFPDLFDALLLLEVERWLENRQLVEERDPYLCSAVANGTSQEAGRGTHPPAAEERALQFAFDARPR